MSQGRQKVEAEKILRNTNQNGEENNTSQAKRPPLRSNCLNGMFEITDRYYQIFAARKA